MRDKIILNRGFVGLLALLIGVAIIAFLIIRTDLFSGQKDGKNMIQKNQDYINKAKDVKNIIEQNNAKATEEL